MPFGSEGLVVTWTVPIPKEAKVTYSSGDIFNALEKVAGSDIHPELPKKYTQNLQKSALFNAHLSWEGPELIRWEKRYGIDMLEKPMAAFGNYFRTGRVVFGTLVSHPKVPDPKRWIACSVILQRGVIVMDQAGRETLFLRSYFHSAKQSVRKAPEKGGTEEQEQAILAAA
jgi:hypothetical protein